MTRSLVIIHSIEPCLRVCGFRIIFSLHTSCLMDASHVEPYLSEMRVQCMTIEAMMPLHKHQTEIKFRIKWVLLWLNSPILDLHWFPHVAHVKSAFWNSGTIILPSCSSFIMVLHSVFFESHQTHLCSATPLGPVMGKLFPKLILHFWRFCI